ncbi:F-box protein FBW2-like [Nymphaea colorata]|nr:F-box protein FBW2-like [Nymphaea colorata]
MAEVRERKVGGGGEGEGAGFGWESMSPEVLALVFVRLPLKEMAGVVPCVCRSWREVIMGPHCWAEIDVEEWCRRVNDPCQITNLLNKLVARSAGSVRKLSAYRVDSDYTFASIASRSPCLQTLRLPLSAVRNAVVVKFADRFSKLTVLDISYCINVGPSGIEAIGRHCKSLLYFKRHMPPFPGPDRPDDREALAVASTMRQLKHLEMGYGRFGDAGLDAILLGCAALLYLDIRGCWNVEMKGDLEERCLVKTVFKDPDFEMYDTSSEEDDDEDDVAGSESD